MTSWAARSDATGTWASQVPTGSASTTTHTIARDSTGLLARHDYDNASFAFSANDWTPQSSLSVSVVASKLRLNADISGTVLAARYTSLTSRSALFVQAVIQPEAVGGSNLQLGVAAHIPEFGSINTHVNHRYTVARSPDEIIALQEHQNGVTDQSTTTVVATRTTGVSYRIGLHVRDSRATGYDHTSDKTLALTVDMVSGGPGLVINSGAAVNGRGLVEHYRVMTDAAIAVSGLASGEAAQVVDANSAVLSRVTAFGSAVSLSVLTAAMPATAVEVLDAAGTRVARIAPAAGVWGGDAYSVTTSASHTSVVATSWAARSGATAAWSTRTGP